METYASGRNRVHTSSSKEQILAAIAEYDDFVKRQPSDPLAQLLQECAADLREELELRERKAVA